MPRAYDVTVEARGLAEKARTCRNSGASSSATAPEAELSRTWFFASGIQSSYELSLVDAQMAGATIVDVGGVAQLAAIGQCEAV